MDSQIKKTSSNGSKLILQATEHDDKNHISKAFRKFNLLNKEFIFETESPPKLDLEFDTKPFRKKNGKTDDFTIMTKLRHLENAALIGRAKQEEQYKERMRKNSFCKRNKGKTSNSLYVTNPPYLTTYDIFKKEQSQNIDPFNQDLRYKVNETPQLQSETQQSPLEEDQVLKLLSFSKELRPYKRILRFTKDRIKMQSSNKSESPTKVRKADSLNELNSAEQNKNIYQDYAETAKIFTLKSFNKEKEKSKSLSIEQAMKRQMSRIYKKKVQQKQGNQISYGSRRSYSFTQKKSSQKLEHEPQRNLFKNFTQKMSSDQKQQKRQKIFDKSSNITKKL